MFGVRSDSGLLLNLAIAGLLILTLEEQVAVGGRLD